jgi:hypothetical protein
LKITDKTFMFHFVAHLVDREEEAVWHIDPYCSCAVYAVVGRKILIRQMKRNSRNSLKASLTLVEDSFDSDSIIPKQILLSDGMIKIGRGSPTVPVDVILAIK